MYVMDYIYNYAFLWISLITRTKRFFPRCYEKKEKKRGGGKKKKESRAPSNRSFATRDEPESKEGGEERKRNKNLRFRFLEKEILDTILFSNKIYNE